MRRIIISLIFGGFAVLASSSTGCGPHASCPETLTACGGFCFDLDTSAEHCGACGITCSSGQTCFNGACTSGGSDAGTTLPDAATPTPDSSVAESGPTPETGPGTADPCRNVTQSGVYCGTSTQANFDSSNANAQTLYTCKNGVTTNTQSCGAAGCADGGTNTPDFCLCPCWGNPGDYCGSAIQSYSSSNGSCGTVQGGANANYLYSCSGSGSWTLKTACTNGCSVNQGVADTCFCQGGKVCGSNCCPSGNFCGANNACCDGSCKAGCPC